MSDLLSSAPKNETYKGAGLADIKRRFAWEFNGMRLHELYFGNLGKEMVALDGDGSLCERLAECFGSLEHWRRDFAAMGSMRGIGWVMLAHDESSGRL